MEANAPKLGETERIVKRYDFPQEEWTKDDATREDSLIITDKRVIKRDAQGEVFTRKEVLLSEVDQVQTAGYPRNIIEVGGALRNIKSLDFFLLAFAIALLIGSYILSIVYDFYEGRSAFWITSIVLGAIAFFPLLVWGVKLLKRKRASTDGSISIRKKVLLFVIVSVATLCFIGFFFMMGYHRWRLNIAGIVVGGFSISLIVVSVFLFVLSKKQTTEKKYVLRVSILKRSTDACVLCIEKEFDTKEQAAMIADEIGSLLFGLRSDGAASAKSE